MLAENYTGQGFSIQTDYGGYAFCNDILHSKKSDTLQGVESADPQVVTTTDKFMVRIRPLLPSKIKGEKPEKYMVLSL